MLVLPAYTWKILGFYRCAKMRDGEARGGYN